DYLVCVRIAAEQALHLTGAIVGLARHQGRRSRLARRILRYEPERALTPNRERTMKFMLISCATKDWEAGLPPDPRLLATNPRLYEKMPKAVRSSDWRTCSQLDGREGPGVGREGSRDRRAV